jgi:toxin FitB
VPDLLVDTGVFVDHLRGARPLQPGARRLSYSVITRCELFAGRDGDEEAISVLLGALREIPVDRTVAERAGRLRRESSIRTPDALIAASALEHGLSLMTRNRRDFAGVTGLKLVDTAR